MDGKENHDGPQRPAVASRASLAADDAALTVGATVHRLREERGWSLQRLAGTARLSKQHLWDIERGLARPNELTIKNLARALGTRVADLMGETVSESSSRPVSTSLHEFARRRGLGVAQVEALAGLNYRGRAPQTPDEWEMIWRLLRAVLDDDANGGNTTGLEDGG